MKDRNSKSYIILQPPAGFHTSRPDGVITLSDGTPLKPDPQGFYHLDCAHAYLLRMLVAQGWHAPRAEIRTPKYAREVESAAHGDMLDTTAILKLASGEQVDLTVKDGRMLMRGEPSARLRAHLRGAGASLHDELERRMRNPWIEV
jgi:hypothetical protein